MSIPYYSMDLNQREVLSVIQSLCTFSAFDGPAIGEYEKKIQEILNCNYVIPSPSGRSGFYSVIHSLFKPGDEVIVSIYSFPLYVRLLHEMGVRPVFVDVEEGFGLINPNLIEAKITPKTKGILVTHLFGNPCEMDSICALAKKYNFRLIEDCAHAFKSTYKGRLLGTFGDAGVFSTSVMKVPTTLGGGFVVTNDDKISQDVKNSLYQNPKYTYSFAKLQKLFALTMIYYLNSYPAIFVMLSGKIFEHLELHNPGKIRQLFYSQFVTTKPFDPFERLRFSNLQAKVGLSQIERFDAMTQIRRKYAEIYRSYFKNSPNVHLIEEKENGFNNDLYFIASVSPDCTEFIANAAKNGVFLMREDCWDCNEYAFSRQYEAPCPVGKNMQPKLVRLPNSSLLSEKQIHQTAQTLLKLSRSNVQVPVCA